MLEFLGLVFLALIGFVAAFVVWMIIRVRRVLAAHMKVTAIEEGMEPPELRLEPVLEPNFVCPDEIADLREQAERAGLEPSGVFEARTAGARVIAYAATTPPAYVVIYDHDQVEPWIDAFARIDGDRSFTASTVPEIARGAPRHPNDEIVHFAPGTMLGVLLKGVAERVANEPTLPATPAEFKTVFEAAAERSRKCIQTQQISQEWLDDIAADAGVELMGGEAEQINFGRSAQQFEETRAACIRSLAESGKYSAAQWDELRDRLVAVWDDMPADFVSSVIWDHVDVPVALEDAVEELESAAGSVRERIARFNASLPVERRLRPLGTVSAPVPADIYLSQFDAEQY